MSEGGSRWRQVIAAVLANLSTMIGGCAMGWSSPSLPRLREPDSFLPITDEEASWIGSLLLLGAAVGPFAGGLVADKIGRRWTLLTGAVPYVISWILIMVADSVAMLYAARLIGGLALGSLCAVVPMYVGEIAEDSIRGTLGSLFGAFINVGCLYAYLFGAFVPYLWLGVASIVLPCVFAVTFYFMPESPYYLLARGNRRGANQALKWFRNNTTEGVAAELEQMQKSVEESSKQSGSIKDLFASRASRKSIYLACGLMTFLQFSGINAVLFYTVDIFQEAGGSLSGDISTIVVGTVFVVAGFTAVLLVERLGRRQLLFISATGMAIAQTIMGLYFYLKTETDTDVSPVGWLPILCLVVYFPCFCIGLSPVPWIVMCEIFPSNVKGIGNSITASLSWLLGFVITKLFPLVVDKLGAHTAFWIFAGCCVLADIFVFFLLPETRGKSLQEIQDTLNKRSEGTRSMSMAALFEAHRSKVRPERNVHA